MGDGCVVLPVSWIASLFEVCCRANLRHANSNALEKPSVQICGMQHDAWDRNQEHGISLTRIHLIKIVCMSVSILLFQNF